MIYLTDEYRQSPSHDTAGRYVPIEETARQERYHDLATQIVYAVGGVVWAFAVIGFITVCRMVWG